jgi:OOP family OmpA-OmpF porin
LTLEYFILNVVHQSKYTSDMKRILFIIFLFASQFTYAQQPEATTTEALVNVSVTDFKSKPRASETILFESKKTKKIFETVSDLQGKSSLLLPKGDLYTVKYKGFMDKLDYDSITIPPDKGLFTMTIKIQIEQEAGKTYTLENVFFDTGKSTFRPESYNALDELTEAMKSKPSLVIEISGHTDNVGTPASNLKLSGERAGAVKTYLAKKGIALVRVTTVGYGDTQPVADNDSETGRQKNRRTEVKIIRE